MLRNRLKLLDEWCSVPGWLESLETAQLLPPNASEYDKAWGKFGLASTRSKLALASYFAGDSNAAKIYGGQCLEDCEEFFFGEWRNTYTTENKQATPAWWKREFIWMQVFEAALLWGAVLGDWAFLKKVGAFPESDSCISDGYDAQDRDLYVAVGGFVCGLCSSELNTLLHQASSGAKKSCKLLVSVIRACEARQTNMIQKALSEFFKNYEQNEFPKKQMTKKISIEGTFIVHWIEREKLGIGSIGDFADFVVRLP
jgi:hypothetical protein